MTFDKELMHHHINVLFKHDMEDRMTFVNEPPYHPAPKIFIGTTKKGCVVKYADTLPASCIAKLEKAIQKSSSIDLAEIIKIFQQKYEINQLWMGRAYVFPDKVKIDYPQAIQITHENKDMLKSQFPYTFEDFTYKQPCFVIIEENVIASICCGARKSIKADEASLFTNEAYRGKGYGAAVTKAWAQEVQRQGRIALYSTSWDNLGSQSVASRLSLYLYGTDIHIS
ncbi:GNAT family N-acetyltransferase [Oceanobacillus sp. CFH 90083]|uniref:GNAT family N-acetyltransferase n=1 Tax=Oceanobacillus sp. CFH 90083 TaxID=2592336 RepID=UPI00128C059F|nr:GNAT family N-acetyltransferase [Oceanobacillus sp. CFH 90083]